jgi:AraC-like DNA-binding protein
VAERADLRSHGSGPLVKEAESFDAFIAAPVGRYVVLPTCVGWVEEPSLGGVIAWGRPDAEGTRQSLDTFRGLWAPAMATRVTVVLDGSRLTGVLPESLTLLVAWAATRRLELIDRIAMQVGVIPEGIAGFALAGILSTFEAAHAYRIVHDPREAMRRALPDDGARADALSKELAAIVERAMGAPHEMVELGRLIRNRAESLTLDEAASALAVSSRSLQRLLHARGTTFQDELRRGRYEVAAEILSTTDAKIAVVASRVGLSEQALTQLFREHGGETPGAFRTRSRSASSG